MGKLTFYGRPWTVFDPANEDHRRWFAEFQVKQCWGGCPVRFVIDDDTGDLITMIRRRLIDYYINEEFGEITC